MRVTRADLMTVEDIATLLRVDPSRVRQLSRQGGFPAPILQSHSKVWATVDVLEWCRASRGMAVDAA